MALPNILTLFRIALIPVIVIALLLDGALARWVAIALFAVAAITDYLDGYFARRLNIISPLGRMLDPIADKLLVGAVIITLSYNGGFTLPLLGAAIAIMMREIAIAGLREFLGSQQIIVNVTPLAKYKTTTQLIALGAIMLVPVMSGLAPFAAALMWLATALTVYSGYDYFVSAWPHLKEDA